MKCPHCNRTMYLPSYAERNMESYQKSCIVNTLCCGNAVLARPVVTFEATVYDGLQSHDDWGKPIKQAARV